MDFSNMSDEELEKIARTPTQDFSAMSDAELERIANPPSVGTSALRQGVQGVTGKFSDELVGLGEAAGRLVGIEGAGSRAPQDMTVTKPAIGWGGLGPSIEWKVLKESYKMARDKERGNLKADEKANPTTSMIAEGVGGLATAVVPVGQAANLGRAATIGAGMGGVAGLGGSESDTAIGDIEEMLKGAAIGGALGGAGYGVGKGAQAATNAISKKLAPVIAQMLPAGKKANAAQVMEAAERLGFKATPGMTTDSATLQKLESSLHQAPTVGGWLTRRGTNSANKGMQGATDRLIEDAATVSPYESGEMVKKVLSKEVDKKFAPSKKIFEDLKQYTKDIPSTESSTKAVSRNIMNIPEVDTLELPLAKQVVRQLEKNPTVDQIKTLRTMVGKQAEAADGAEASAYWKIYEKLGNLEENSLKRGVIASARTKGEGDQIAKGMLGQLKDAKRGYSGQMENLENLGQASRLGKFSGPEGFKRKIDAVPSERLQEKLLPLEDVRLASEMQKQFPEAFGGLRRARLRDISEGVVSDGQTLPGKFLQKTKGLNPEAEGLLFPGKTADLKDLRTTYAALPEKVGPSGTQQAFDVAGMFNPVNQARDLARYAGYKIASSDSVDKIAKALRKSPQFNNMAESNPKAFQATVYQMAEYLNPAKAGLKAADQKKNGKGTVVETSDNSEIKGESKWAVEGLNNLIDHDKSGLLSDPQVIEKLISSPQGKKLLVSASDLKPGSKAMEKIYAQIGKGKG